MIKPLLVVILLVVFAHQQKITPYYILPVQTTQNVITSYSFLFYTDTAIPSSAQVSVTFPFEFNAGALTQVSRVRFAMGNQALQNASWSLNIRTFTIQINQIAEGNITIVIDNVLNPKDYTTSSAFQVQTLFQSVVVTSNTNFGRTPLTPAPIVTTGGTFSNTLNKYIEQGSSWIFTFTPSTTYSYTSSLRFIFPPGFSSNKVQCNVSGVVDPNMQTRVFPSQNVYDCLNLAHSLSGSINVILSGLVNPNYQMTTSGVQVHILQPNNLIVQEIITSTSTVLIQNKPLNTTLTIPNNYRNNSVTYTFQINTATNLNPGDYMTFTFGGIWNLNPSRINVVGGLASSLANKAIWKASVNTSASTTTLSLTNFSSILQSTQFTFYLPLTTPLNPNTYSLNIKAYRQNGGLAQSYSSTILINQTTGYINQMKLHPMQSPVKLPVGMTGPIQIVLFLRNNLPQTNVLTYGQIVIQITPNIPEPIVSLNGIPKCYFYSNIPAANCTFNSTDPTKTVVTIFTPINFNFQQSQVPLTITTQGYQQPQNQGITIDTLVKRYFFEIQFYSHLRPYPTPLQVIFDQWIPNSIGINTVSCTSVNRNVNEYDHIKCQFVTPAQVLNNAGHIHYFRVEFQSGGWVGASNIVTPNYPCLMYGANVGATPYVKCDYITWQSGPYSSSKTSTSYNYITFYGLSTIPGGSTITFQIPKIQRNGNSGWSSTLGFSILEETPGYNSPFVYIYTQSIDPGYNTGGCCYYSYWQSPSITLSNSVVNKVTSITLNSYSLGSSGATHVILQVDQSAFPNIGRQSGITCGSYTCSKFDIPIQYFVVYPSSPLSSSATLVFPNIMTPPYSGNFQFNTRVYQNGNTLKKGQFWVTVTPDTITDRSFKFSALQTISTLYPNSDHFYTVSWALVNQLKSIGGNSYVTVTFNNVFSFSSTYCQLTTTATAYDGRGIVCDMVTGGTTVTLKNIADAAVGTAFNLTVQLKSTATTATVSPTLSIYTYYGTGNLVDQAINVPFVTTPLTNTNLTVFSSFSLPTEWSSTRDITAGYFGHLLLSFTPQSAGTVINGSKIIVTLPSGFYPAGNALNLPISCMINGVSQKCTYILSPNFTITFTQTNSTFGTGVNVLNITTMYQNMNGIYYPSTQGRYLLQLQILNASSSQSLQKVQQYVNILPGEVGYFNVSWAVRDQGVYNIYTIQFKNGANTIASYNDGANPGRIYFGFPILNANNGGVFASNLGFSGIKEGSILPCFFQTALGFVGATSGKTLQCKIRMSYMNNYHTWIQIVNFAAITPGQTLRVFIAKITNPTQQNIDINFLLKVNTLSLSTNIETQVYHTKYNMFIDMVPSSISNINEQNSSSAFFQPGAYVGMSNQYFNITPYTANTFSNNDWWIVDLDPQFPLSGSIYNCQKPFYQYCIIYPTINWLAVKIGNGSIISLQPFISQLPISISRVDTYFNVYTFLQGRWAETIRYTITAATRWMALRGAISNFTFSVVGSQNKLNVGQTGVQVLVSFKVQHMVPVGGTIEIQFPNNATTVPAIKMHCRSAVTMGSLLYGYNTGKPTPNVQGQIGCSVQNTYSWLITGFDTLPAGSQVVIYGVIDFPTVAVNTLGMGYVCTYSNQDSNAFINARTIDYLQTNFPLQVQNMTWKVDQSMVMLQTAPLRVNFVGDFRFMVTFDSTFTCSSFTQGSCGWIYINLYRTSITGNTGGFGAPPSTLVCTIFNLATLVKYGCSVSDYGSTSNYYGYKITSYESLPANTNLQVTITSLQGSQTEGLVFPTEVGVYKTEIEINYCSTCSNDKAQAQYIEVYGPNWSTLFFNSTVTIPNQNNFIIVTLLSSISISTTQQIVIEIPTVDLAGGYLFPADLGMGYKDGDSLVFDLFQSQISSMTCKVYPGSAGYKQPTKIVCSNFASTVATTTLVKFGFWVVNPTTSVGMAIPVQVYAYDQPSARKFVWSIIEGGIRVLPVTTTPINDWGNFVSSNPVREVRSTSFSFTTRNTKSMIKNDWYIMKFGFDLRQSANSNNTFAYNSGLGGSGDIIFMRNCQTIMLRVGSTALAITTPGSTSINARITSLFYNPSYQLNTLQSTIYAYIIYNSIDVCERVYYRDLFPQLPPNQPTGESFTITPIFGINQKGMRDDWKIQFSMGSGATNSTSLVKLISIQFPNVSTSDVQILSRSCIEYITSTIEVANCVIDVNYRTIWVTPVVKSTYTDDNTLIIQTNGLAIRTAITSQTNKNQFTIRYFTWPNSMSNPGITAGNDNWCFMKQDPTSLSSSALVYTNYASSYIPQHSYLDTPQQLYINEWQPASYWINNGSSNASFSKSPFSFKLIAPVAFSAISTTTTNYHSISVDFGSVYNHSTLNQQNNDLYFYVPVCYLNGFSILKCSISSSTITMQFQQAIANGEVVAVTLSVINPKDQTDYGFNLIDTSKPTTTLPITIYNYGTGVTYYLEQQPFHTFYKTVSAGATYPSYGIQTITMVQGTQVQGALNYLQFTLTLTRTDINGFVIQIPVQSNDGTIIYNNPKLMGLDSGSQYPCSMGINVAVYCYYHQGNNNGFSTPTRIYVTGFSLSSTSVSFRMLFTNPDNPNVYPTFIWKAFGGSVSPPNLMGFELRGYHTVIDAFRVYTPENYNSSSTLYCYPTSALWQTGTYYDFYTSEEHVTTNGYAILQWPLVDPTYGTIGDYTFVNAYDQFYIQTAQNQYYVYLVKKLTSGYTAANGGSSIYGYISSYYRFGYLRMKHHIVNSYKLYILGLPWTKTYTASVPSSYVSTHRANNWYGTMSMRSVDTQVRVSGWGSWMFLSINAGNIMGVTYGSGYDPSEKVVQIIFTNGHTGNWAKQYQSLGSSSQCQLESGLIGNDPLNPILCQLYSANNSIVFYNVYWFTNTFLNLYYYGVTNSDTYHIDVAVYVWANVQAYNDRSWPLYYSVTDQYWTYDPIYYASNTGASCNTKDGGCYEQPFGNDVMDLTSGGSVTATRILGTTHLRSEGGAQIIKLDSTNLWINLFANTNYNFQQVFRVGFRFYLPRLWTTTCVSVSMYSSSWDNWFPFSGDAWYPGSSNKYCGNGGAGTQRIYAIFDMYATPSSTNQLNQWPTFSGYQNYQFRFTFSSITGDVSNYPNSVWVTASMVMEWSYYYYEDNNPCGCCYYPCCDTDQWGYCTRSCCQRYCSCRQIKGWDFQTFTGTNMGSYPPYSQPTNAIASSANIYVISNQYNVETQFSFYLYNLQAPITSAMTSFTDGTHGELLFSFDSNGNTNYPGSPANPFPYTPSSQSAAYIQCLCATNSGSFSISYSTSYVAANCTRYLISGMNPFVGVRVDAPVGKSLRCFFPGYRTPSWSDKYQISVSFFWNKNHYFINQQLPYDLYSRYQTLHITYGLNSQDPPRNFYSIHQNNQFWSDTGETNSNANYYLYLQMYVTYSNPAVYYSRYYPKPSQSACQNTGFIECRTYSSFTNRRYFMVAIINNDISYVTFNYNTAFPQSKDYSSSFYNYYIGWTMGGYSRYDCVSAGNDDSSKLKYATPTYDVAVPVYGNTLQGSNTPFVISANLDGFILHSNQRKTGPFIGSYMKVVASGFSTLYGCGAYLHYNNNPVWANNAIYCQIISSNTLKITSNFDIPLTGTFVITLSTDSVPSTTTFTLTLYEKYISSSDYAISVQVSSTKSDSPGSYTLLPSTNVLWRRQTYKQLQTASGPLRVTLNNNFQYVSQYVMSSNAQDTTNSNAIIFSLPSTVGGGTTFKCVVREYSPTKYQLYDQYPVTCTYYSGTQVLIQSRPSHILNPSFYYDFIVYINGGSGTPFISANSAANYHQLVWSGKGYTSSNFNTMYFDALDVSTYQAVYPIKLSSIYILTKEAATLNSLYVDFTVTVATSSAYLLELIFDALDLNYFGITNGGNIPCYINDLSGYSNKINGVNCYGYSDDANKTSPLIIRVVNFAGFSANKQIRLAFDNFNNPPLQPLFLVPINLRINLQDYTNQYVYTSYFPNIYVSDSINIYTTIKGTINANPANDYHGASTYSSWNNYYSTTAISWPYSSGSNVWDKLVFKMNGGATCCRSFSSLAVLTDNYVTYTPLWINTKANTSVYVLASRSGGTSTTFYINNIINPNPVNYATYQQSLSGTLSWYSVHKTYAIYTYNQPSYSAYAKNSDFTVCGSPSFISSSDAPHNPTHPAYPLIYQFSWNIGANSYTNRNISYILLYFTGGLNYIESAWFRYGSGGVINPIGTPVVDFDGSKWFVNITNVQTSAFSTSYDWYLRVRLIASSSNHVTYSSTVYNFNGQQEFTASTGEFWPSNDGFSTNGLYGKPTAWNIAHLRYTPNYYELARTYLYASPGRTTNKLFFKFTSPYNISQTESFSFVSSSSSVLVSNTLNNGIYCIIQKTITPYVSYGAGLYADCAYFSGTFTVNVPIGGLIYNQEYLLTIIDRQQLTSQFAMSTAPQRIQVSLIYNNMLSLAYGDVYTLDFFGYMSDYSMDHAHLQSGNEDMLGFWLQPSFTLSASSTASPVTESVISFEVESKYYDTCLNLATIFGYSTNMPFYNGAYYSHYTNYPVADANTRIMCGSRVFAQEYAPAKLTITDYGALSTSIKYYFRFPLITLPSGTNVPLTYKSKLLFYANGVPYPTIISMFNYEAKYLSTPPSNEYLKSATLTLTVPVVQTTMSMQFSYNSANYGNGDQTLVFYGKNNYPALTNITTLSSLSNSNMNYQFYPNINLCSFIFTGSSGDTINLGSYPTSIDQQDFKIKFVHTYLGTVRWRGYFNGNSQNAIYTVNAASSWTTSTFTKGNNILTTNSEDLFTVRWSANYLTFPQGSSIVVTFPYDLALMDEYCYSYTGFSQGGNSNLVCKRYSDTQILISGYANITASTTMGIQVFMKILNSLSINSTSGSNNNFTTYATVTVSSAAGNTIISADTVSLTLVLSNQRGSSLIGLSGTMTTPYSAGTTFPLYISFQLNTHTLTNGDYLHVDFGNWVLDTASSGVQIFKYRLANTIYWVPAAATLVSGNIYKVPVYLNYSMTAGTQITLWVDTFAPTLYYGAKVNSNQWNTFKIYAYHSSVLVEQNVFRIWTEPYGHPSLVVSPVLNYVNVATLYEFSFTPNISASSGDSILIQFTTADGLNTNLYSNTIGATISSPKPGSFDCNQAYGVHVISNSGIACRVYQGNNGASPSVPTTIIIPISKSIAANTFIKFNILGITNPGSYSYPIGITIKLASTCSSSDTNNLCAYYKSSTYLSFNSAPGGIGYSYTGSLSFSPSRVSATNTVHTVTAGYGINVGDFIRLNYYSQVPIPTTCTITSSNAECYSYPTSNTIMIKALTAQPGSYTFSLGGMTNPYQNFYGSYTFYTQIYRNGYIYQRHYSDYTASTITVDPTSGSALSMSFTPTLTPNYQLKYGFKNIVIVSITNLLQNNKVKLIYITAPSEITIDSSYCNATMKTYPGQALPYPYRFVCQSLGGNYVMLNLQSDFPGWTANFTGRSINVYLRYTIQTYQMGYSNYWYARAYTDPSSTSWYYQVSQATGRFDIVEYQTPYLYVISLFTRSFQQRTCNINEMCMFYGFLYPSTPSTTMDIRYMSFLLPKEFNYSTVQTLSACTLQPTTPDLYSVPCTVSRNNSQVTILYVPNNGNYNQGYNLLNLDHSNPNMLFTAPAYPGNHYQMQVNLWSSSNQLVQSQKINITTVYGYFLSVPAITFLIPMDGGAYGLFDLTFTVGNADILPSYINSASNSVTSAIEISFANTFEADLGTGLQAGSDIACLSVSGLTFNTMGRIRCQIYPSVSTITYPTIIVTGYDRIYANTIVRIQFANLKTLPTGITDYCTLGASLTYFNYGGTKGYIYQPVSFVVGPPTAPTAPASVTFTVSELGSNTVGQLTNYSFAGTVGSSVSSSDYFVVQFPPYTFQGRFNLNSQALCSLATGNKCFVFGLANQIYIQPSTTVAASSFSFTIKNILNAAYSIQYINRTVTIFTVVGRKVTATGSAVFLKFTQSSSNISSIITSIDSIYGGDSNINYYFSFQLNSYLPETGKISVFFPTAYTSLFTLNSKCFLRWDSQALIGEQAYCSIISSNQLVIVPNGVLLSSSQPYYFTVTNITNPNFALTSYRFSIFTYYSSSVYQPNIISTNTFASPILSLITVKVCKLQVNVSISNPNLPAQYQLSLICPSPIKEASQLKVYLPWNPATTNTTCNGDTTTLYSSQCNILNQYSGTTKLTFLNIYLRSITAQKLVSVGGTITNGNQGSYTLNATISYNNFVYMNAVSNSFYITSASASSNTAATSSSSGSVITATGQAISIRGSNYPLNRMYSSIYTFALTSPQFVVSTLQIVVPSIITQSTGGISCNYQPYTAIDNYFRLMLTLTNNPLSCSMSGQTISISGLTTVLSNLSPTAFLYLSVSGLVNPQTSVSQTNFTFTFINTTSTYTQAVLLFTLPLSYAVSNPPLDMQIGAIQLSNSKYFVVSSYTFTLGTVNGVTLTITQNSSIGLLVRFPKEYAAVWNQITVPSMVNLTIGATTYIATNVTMSTRYLYASLPANSFTSQVSFTSFKISFVFRNPNTSIDCSVNPVFTISLFDFKANSIYAQTLSNNKLCPPFSTYLYTINVTGNTKISAGSSSPFTISLQKPAYNLTITPNCTSSAISFSPASIVFSGYSSLTNTFNISAANGLNGTFNVTFSKVQGSGSYTFYNDIQFITLNVYVPTQQYYIKVAPFSTRSVGTPIIVTVELEVASPNSFALTTTNNCSSYYTITPTVILIPAQVTSVNYSITYSGTTIPPACAQTFKISSLTTNYYYLQNQVVYYSASLSIDKSYVESPMVLQLTTTPKNSQDVGHTIVTTSSTSTSSGVKKYIPTVYTLVASAIGSNRANFTATTSYIGVLYYAVVTAGTPASLITATGIYGKSLSSGVVYGSADSGLLVTSGVNIITQFAVSGMKVQTNYTIAVYLNSTVGISPIFFRNFTTSKVNNGAAIKIAMTAVVNTTAYIKALSQVLRINSSRIYVLTPSQVLTAKQNSFQSSVMNNRYYIYDTIIAPNPIDDTTPPLQILNNFLKDNNAQAMLALFITQYIPSYPSTVRQIVNVVPRIRTPIKITAQTYQSVTFSLSFWDPAFVYAVILENNNKSLLSTQVIKGLNENNTNVITQHYINVTSDQNGFALITFKLLKDNTTYKISVSAQCPLPYGPRLALSDSNVLTATFKTTINPNLMKNKQAVISSIAAQNPTLAAEAKKQNDYVSAQNSISGVDKTKKIRKHG